jgi:hypothetical protein
VSTIAITLPSTTAHTTPGKVRPHSTHPPAHVSVECEIAHARIARAWTWPPTACGCVLMSTECLAYVAMLQCDVWGNGERERNGRVCVAPQPAPSPAWQSCIRFARNIISNVFVSGWLDARVGVASGLDIRSSATRLLSACLMSRAHCAPPASTSTDDPPPRPTTHVNLCARPP